MTEPLHPDRLPVSATPVCDRYLIPARLETHVRRMLPDFEAYELERRARDAETRLAELKSAGSNSGSSQNLRDWLESVGALRVGARIGWASVTWTVCALPTLTTPFLIENDETGDRISLAECASLPALGWRVLE